MVIVMDVSVADLQAENARLRNDLLVVHATLDWVGVESGEVRDRCFYLRGAVRGFQLGMMGMRWPVAVAEAPAEMARQLVAEPTPEVQPEPVNTRFVGTSGNAAEPLPDTDKRHWTGLLVNQDHGTEPSEEPEAAAPPQIDPPAPQPDAIPDDEEPVVDWEAESESAEDPDPIPDTSGHHPSWADASAAFCALIKSEFDEDYEVIAAYTQNLIGKRPSQMDPATRGGLVGALVNNSNGARDRFVEWAAIRGPDVLLDLKNKKAEAAKARKAAASGARKAKRAAALKAGQRV